MFRRVPIIAVLAALVFSGGLSAAASADTTLPLPLPNTMAAVGDSITQAASTGGSLGADYPQNSWSTGTNSTVNSHYLRLLALGAQISGQNSNLSVSGAKAAGLNAQMVNVGAIDPAYLTVQIGGNDLCTDTFAQMTSVTDFRAQFQTAMATLATGSPNTNVYVVSIPDAYQLWSLFKGNGWARFIWSLGGICQSLLANPTSTQAVDVQRRLDVQLRNIAYNTQLAEVCAAFEKCRFDNNAVFNTQFTTSDVAGDYFHPSIAGQAKLSSGTWAAGYAWATSPPPPNQAPTALFTSSCTYLTCTFTDASTDSDGTIAARSWTFGDGSPLSTAQNPSHTYLGTGTYTVALTVTDNDGASGLMTSSVTVNSPPTAQQMWVDSLTSTTKAGRRSWTATVTIHVTGAAGSVAGVSVVGSWSPGSGATSCTTGSTGSCSLKSSSIANATPLVTFTVTGLTKTDWTYQPSSNFKTFIDVSKP